MTATIEMQQRSDGRSARRARGRAAVVDAAFDLVAETGTTPAMSTLAARAGVSQASVFRYFDGVDDLHGQVIEHFLRRYADLLEFSDVGTSIDTRVNAFVAQRLRLYEATGQLLRLTQARAVHLPAVAAQQANFRRNQRDRVVELFRTVLGGDVIVATVIDSIASPEAWYQHTAVHGMSRDQVEHAWSTTIRTLLEHAAAGAIDD